MFLRANAQKYREKDGHVQDLTNLCFEFKERFFFSKYGFFAGIFGKMDFTLSLAKKCPNKLAKLALKKNSTR